MDTSILRIVIVAATEGRGMRLFLRPTHFPVELKYSIARTAAENSGALKNLRTGSLFNTVLGTVVSCDV